MTSIQVVAALLGTASMGNKKQPWHWYKSTSVTAANSARQAGETGAAYALSGLFDCL